MHPSDAPHNVDITNWKDKQLTSVLMNTRRDNIQFITMNFVCNEREWQVCLWKVELTLLLDGFETGIVLVNDIEDGDIYTVTYCNGEVTFGLSHRAGNGSIKFTKAEIAQLVELIKDSSE